MDTLERIKELFVEQLEFRDDALVPGATLESLGIDSLDKIEFMFALEDAFKIKIPEREVKIATIQDLVDIVDRLMAEQQGAAESPGAPR